MGVLSSLNFIFCSASVAPVVVALQDNVDDADTNIGLSSEKQPSAIEESAYKHARRIKKGDIDMAKAQVVGDYVRGTSVAQMEEAEEVEMEEAEAQAQAQMEDAEAKVPGLSAYLNGKEDAEENEEKEREQVQKERRENFAAFKEKNAAHWPDLWSAASQLSNADENVRGPETIAMIKAQYDRPDQSPFLSYDDEADKAKIMKYIRKNRFVNFKGFFDPMSHAYDQEAIAWLKTLDPKPVIFYDGDLNDLTDGNTGSFIQTLRLMMANEFHVLGVRFVDEAVPFVDAYGLNQGSMKSWSTFFNGKKDDKDEHGAQKEFQGEREKTWEAKRIKFIAVQKGTVAKELVDDDLEQYRTGAKVAARNYVGKLINSAGDDVVRAARASAYKLIGAFGIKLTSLAQGYHTVLGLGCGAIPVGEAGVTFFLKKRIRYMLWAMHRQAKDKQSQLFETREEPTLGGFAKALGYKLPNDDRGDPLRNNLPDNQELYTAGMDEWITAGVDAKDPVHAFQASAEHVTKGAFQNVKESAREAHDNNRQAESVRDVLKHAPEVIVNNPNGPFDSRTMRGLELDAEKSELVKSFIAKQDLGRFWMETRRQNIQSDVEKERSARRLQAREENAQDLDLEEELFRPRKETDPRKRLQAKLSKMEEDRTRGHI